MYQISKRYLGYLFSFAQHPLAYTEVSQQAAESLLYHLT